MSTTRTVLRWAAPLSAVAIALSLSTPAAAIARGLRGTGTAAGSATTTTSGTGTAPLRSLRGTAAAGGCTPTVLSNATTALTTQLTNRETQLEHLQEVVTSARRLTDADRATLSTDLSGQLSGIEGLASQVTSATTCAELRADARSMVVDYRVYVVMTPQVHQTVAGDAELALATQLQSYEPRIAAAIARAQNAGKDVSAPQQAFADMQTQVTTAQQAVATIPAEVLAFTPASYPGCWSSFRSNLTQLRSGVTALRQAGSDLRAVVSDLRSGATGSSSSTS